MYRCACIATHEAGAACPTPPDRSKGYVWAVFPGYDIYRAAGSVRNHFERTVLQPHDLTWTAWVVLWVVWIWACPIRAMTDFRSAPPASRILAIRG